MTTFCCSVVLRASARPHLPFQPLSGAYSGVSGDVVLSLHDNTRQYMPARGRGYRVSTVGSSRPEDFSLDGLLGSDDPSSIHNRLGSLVQPRLENCSLVCVEQTQPSVFVHVTAKCLDLSLIGVSSHDADLLVITTATTEAVKESLCTAIHDPIVLCLHTSPSFSLTIHPRRMVSRWYRLTQEKKDRLLKFAAISRSVLGST
jgi:hypothetical protein